MRLGALRRRNEELAARVQARTAELDQKVAELDRKNDELAARNQELLETQRRAEFIFSALADTLPGALLDGKYRLDEKIGAGGFGVVFRAMHVELARPVAVKVFRPSVGNDSVVALERFRREGMSACRVNHPNAVYVLDSGISSEGVAYLVMELLSGRSLADELAEKKVLPLARCVEILTPVCDALGVAHAAGLIHRDIKPDNVFLHHAGGEEIVKVVDFGIAKLLERATEPSQSMQNATEGLIGTPSYMAPERLTSQTYDHRSDVYSVGVMAYQMISGQLPFPVEGKAAFEVLLRQLTDAPTPLRERVPDVPAAVEAIVMRAIAKDMGDRPDVHELARVLAEAVRG
jgi:serine/threonine protein kinase